MLGKNNCTIQAHTCTKHHPQEWKSERERESINNMFHLWSFSTAPATNGPTTSTKRFQLMWWLFVYKGFALLQKLHLSYFYQNIKTFFLPCSRKFCTPTPTESCSTSSKALERLTPWWLETAAPKLSSALPSGKLWKWTLSIEYNRVNLLITINLEPVGVSFAMSDFVSTVEGSLS